MKREQVLPHVMADMAARIAKGADQYGEQLTTNNGRDALQDAYEEALDLALYLKQAIMERVALTYPIVLCGKENLEVKTAWPGPDWSQAPEWAVAWAFLPWCGEGMWFGDTPEPKGSYGDRIWHVCPTKVQSSHSYGFCGEWKDSLRKRPA